MIQKYFSYLKKNKTAILLRSGFVVLLLTGLSVFLASRQVRQDNRRKHHSTVVLAKIRTLLETLLDAETGERGFIITEKEFFLEPYYQAQPHILPYFEDLKAQTSDNPKHQNHLDSIASLLHLKQDFMATDITLVNQGRRAEAEAHVTTGEGKKIMDQIRFHLAQMEDMEIQILEQNTLRDEKSNYIFSSILYLSLGLTFLLTAAAFRNLFSDLKQRVSLSDELLSLKEKAIEASKMKSDFLANMSHEIRTPLNGIRGMTQLLIETPLNDEQKKFVETLDESSISLMALINDILDFSKIESGHLEIELVPVNIAKVVKSVSKVMAYPARHNGLELKVELDPHLPPVVLGDPLRLRQVLLNLVSNAIKFSKQGVVKIRAHVVASAASQLTVRYEVIDTGIGFDAETKERLFKVFSQADSSTTRKYGGTGLGLAISKQLVELRGGKIDAFSELGKGSTFWFEIHYDISSARIAEALRDISDIHLAPGQEAKVLVVEDHKVNQMVIRSLLDKMGCTYELATNGREAVATLQKNTFDVVLMDCHMPEMDGYEATRLIRQGGEVLQPDIPIIATTANAMRGEKEKCLAAGMNDFITKPMALANLRNKIIKWTKKSAAPTDSSMPANKSAPRAPLQDKELLHQIVAIFTETFPQDLKEMRALLENSEYTELSERAHRLKSTCNYLQLSTMVEACVSIEKHSVPESTPLLIENLEKLEKFYKLALENFSKMSEITE